MSVVLGGGGGTHGSTNPLTHEVCERHAGLVLELRLHATGA